MCYHSENFCQEHLEKYGVCLNCFEYGFPCLNCACDEAMSMEYDFEIAMEWLANNDNYYFNVYMNKLFNDF